MPVLHVSFPTPDPEDPFPAMIPMLGFMGSFTNPTASLSEPLDLYLHGYISSRLMRLGTDGNGEEGLPLTIAATHLDGLVLALTPNHHSYNYRSSMYVFLILIRFPFRLNSRLALRTFRLQRVC